MCPYEGRAVSLPISIPGLSGVLLHLLLSSDVMPVATKRK